MMEEMLADVAAFASGRNESVEELSINASCPPQMRRLFTPLGSMGMAAFVTYAIPVMVVFGLIGNIITFVLINESSHRIIGHFYIKWLTILDSLSLICLLPALWAVMVVRPYHHRLDPFSFTWVDAVTSGWGWCQTRLVITFLTRTMSIYTIVLFSLERCIQVMLPFASQRFCTITNAKRSMLVLLILSIGVSMPYIFCFDKITMRRCGKVSYICKANMIFFRTRLFKMLLLSVFPSIIILISNVLIIFKMRRSVRSIYRQPDQEKAGGDSEAERKQNREITIRLLSVSFAFFILNMPLFVVTTAHNVFEFGKKHDHKTGPWADAFYFALFLFVVNLGINFLLYCFTGRMFRKAAVNLILCRMEKMRHYRHSLSGTSKSTRVSHVPRSDSGRKLIRHERQQESQM